MELYGRVRYAVQIEGLSRREAARRFGIDPRTVARMMKFSAPPGYVRKKPPARPKLDPLVPVIDRILLDDKSRPKKQQHTAKRIFERIRDEDGFTGGLTIVKDYVAGWHQRAREMFVPLKHPPGHAQVDFGEAIGIIGGVERKIHFFAFDLPHSDACFVVGYPAETTEAFCDGHIRAFAFFGGVPQSILYDNTRIAVARILGDGKRQRTRAFAELQSHYLFEDRFGRPGKGNDKGKVEGLVGYARRNFLVPIPVFESFEALNAYLLECCRQRLMEVFSADEVATAVRNAIARGAIGFDAHRSRCRPRQQTHVRLGRRHRHMGPRQIRIDRHVEARRSTFDVAQHQVLYCLTTPARRSRRVSRRYHWCATGSTTTRRRRLTVTATCLCAIASMTW